MMSLTHMQAQLLAFIESYQRENRGVSPSYEEMKQELGLASKSGIHRLITALQERGRIIKKYDRARCIEILHENPLANIPSQVLIAELARRGEERRKAA